MKLTELAELLNPPSNHIDGYLVLKSDTATWMLSFMRGQFLYAEDEYHPVRRWDRALKLNNPDWDWKSHAAQLPERQFWQLSLLAQGINQRQLSLIRTKLMIRNIAKECFFELSQSKTLERTWKPLSDSIIRDCRSVALSSRELQMILGQVKKLQGQWQESGLDAISPSLAPTLVNTADVDQLPIDRQYLTGHFTLWDIAEKLSQSPSEIASSLLPYVQQKQLEFQSIADFSMPPSQVSFSVSMVGTQSSAQLSAPAPAPTKALLEMEPSPAIALTNGSSVSKGHRASTPTPTRSRFTSLRTTQPTSPPSATFSSKEPPLIACIDDSPVLAHSLKKIIVPAGYRMLSIQEPMRGFAELIEHRPSLILLDLLLPNADGYSVCKFLRDTPVFAKTPIIILTGQNTVVDRSRARLVGATEFLAKPPQPRHLLSMIKIHLSKNQ